MPGPHADPRKFAYENDPIMSPHDRPRRRMAPSRLLELGLIVEAFARTRSRNCDSIGVARPLRE
jgi:hypothetical protein